MINKSPLVFVGIAPHPPVMVPEVGGARAFEDLDPSVFRVVVPNHSGSRRGLLLPAIESIGTPGQQVGVAARKAGIESGEPLKLYRFRTHRFGEWV